jgi:spore germination protein YaaH
VENLTKKLLIILLVVFGLTLVVAVVLTKNNNGGFLINPLVWKQQEEVKKVRQTKVVGFLPTWMIGKTKMYGQELDQLIFSGIEVGVDGGLVWDLQSKKIDNDDYIALKSSVKKAGGKNLISIKLFTDKNMDKLIADPEARSTLMSEVRDIVVAGNFDGVNVDFEYMSNPTRVLDEDFGGLLAQMKNSGWGEINIDVFANTVIKGDRDRLNELANKVDGVIVMAYDFRRPGADFAGAVAPMGAVQGERSIAEIIQKIVDGNLPKDKFIMAYPLYGYEWETETNEMDSATRAAGYGATVFYKVGIGFTGTNWDELSQSPWVAWQEKAQRSRVVTKKVGKKYKKITEYFMVDQWHQAYFENERSLKIKIEAVKQNQLGGYGFWALGYEGKESNLLGTFMP